MTTASTNSNIVLYGSGLFGRDLRTSNEARLAELQQSGFTTVILWTLHLDDDGSLVYNDTTIVRDGVFAATFNYLPDLLNGLLSTGSVEQLLFCIGSYGVGDYAKIKQLLATSSGKLTLIRNFSALSAALPITGYDFDNEETPLDSDVIAELAELLSGGDRMTITYCPAFTGSEPGWNKGIDAAWTWAQQRTPPVAQPVKWWNLQCYAGGASNEPSDWVNGLSTNAGIRASDRIGYIVPGYEASAMDPTAIQNKFAGLTQSDPGISGGFIWNSDGIFSGPHTLADYAGAIAKGLAGQVG